MTDLSQLLEKVRTATGPDRELDAEIAATLKVGNALPDWAKKWAGEWRPTIQGSVVLMQDDGLPGPHFTAHFYTTSLDAIVALIERELPDYEWLRKSPDTMTVYRRMTKAEDARKQWASHQDAAGATPALALCAAFLSALISKEKADG